jgi:ABC-type uncharacterized transport system auxiliary subunit
MLIRVTQGIDMPVEGLPVRLRTWLIMLALCLMLASCASVPLSTLVRMSSFSQEKFVRLRPEDVGIKIRFAEGFGLDVANSRLAIEVASNSGAHSAAFDLEQTELRPVQLQAGLFSSPQPGVEYEFRLSEESKSQFRQLQAFVARAKVEDIAIRVMPKLGDKPEGVASVVVWIDLRLTPQEGYFALVKAAEISLRK